MVQSVRTPAATQKCADPLLPQVDRETSQSEDRVAVEISVRRQAELSVLPDLLPPELEIADEWLCHDTKGH